MPVLPVPCNATPLSAIGFQNALNALGIDQPTLWAMLRVETSGCGYLASRRPPILFERHIFSRLTGGQFDASNPDISNRIPGGYGASGDNQYTRIGQAYALAPDAALQSASWGLGQVMGENFASVGFASVQDLVAAMCDSEDAQLQTVVAFVQRNNIAAALQNQQWAAYARVYNGPNYAQNQYDTNLAKAFAVYQDPAQWPDLTVRATQLLLTFLGFDPHGVDGRIGGNTIAALNRFQAAQGQALTASIDANALAALQAALPPAPNLNLS